MPSILLQLPTPYFGHSLTNQIPPSRFLTTALVLIKGDLYQNSNIRIKQSPTVLKTRPRSLIEFKQFLWHFPI